MAPLKGCLVYLLTTDSVCISRRRVVVSTEPFGEGFSFYTLSWRVFMFRTGRNGVVAESNAVVDDEHSQAVAGALGRTSNNFV